MVFVQARSKVNTVLEIEDMDMPDFNLTYNRNPSSEDEIFLFGIFREFSKLEYLQIEARDDFSGQDKWIYEGESVEIPVCLSSYVVSDGIEEYRLPISHNERYREGRIRVYNQLINFKHRIQSWKSLYDRSYLAAHDKNIRCQSLNLSCKDGVDFSKFYKDGIDFSNEIDDQTLLNVICSVSPIDSVMNIIKSVRRKENNFWNVYFGVKNGKWNNEEFRWEFRDGFYWDNQKKEWKDLV